MTTLNELYSTILPIKEYLNPGDPIAARVFSLLESHAVSELGRLDLTQEATAENVQPFVKFLEKRWAKIRSSNTAYTGQYATAENNACLELAKKLSPITGRNSYQLLIPSLRVFQDVTGADIDESPLRAYMLSDDGEHLINVPMSIEFANDDGRLKFTSMYTREEGARYLNEAEKARLIASSVEAKAYHQETVDAYSVRTEMGASRAFGPKIEELIRNLRLGGEHGGHGGEYGSAGVDANEAIRLFSEYLESLSVEDRRYLFALKGGRYDFEYNWNLLRRVEYLAAVEQRKTQVDRRVQAELARVMHSNGSGYVVSSSELARIKSVAEASVLPVPLAPQCVELAAGAFKDILDHHKANLRVYSDLARSEARREAAKAGLDRLLNSEARIFISDTKQAAAQQMLVTMSDAEFNYCFATSDRVPANSLIEAFQLVAGDPDLQRVLLKRIVDLGLISTGHSVAYARLYAYLDIEVLRESLGSKFLTCDLAIFLVLTSSLPEKQVAVALEILGSERLLGFVRDYKGFAQLYAESNPAQLSAVLTQLGQDKVLSLIASTENLADLMRVAGDKNSVVSRFLNDRLVELVHNYDDLAQVMRLELSQSKSDDSVLKLRLIQASEEPLQAEIFSNISRVAELLSFFKDDALTGFMAELQKRGFSSLIKTRHDLFLVLSGLSGEYNQGYQMLSQMGAPYLRSLIASDEALVDALKFTKAYGLLPLLGIDHVRSIMTLPATLGAFIKLYDLSMLKRNLDILTSDYLASVITDFDFLQAALTEMGDARLVVAFLGELRDRKVNSFSVDFSRLMQLLSHLPVGNGFSEVELFLGDAFAEAIASVEDLVVMLKSPQLTKVARGSAVAIDVAHAIELVKSLHKKNKLRALIKDADSLSKLMQALEATATFQFIDVLHSLCPLSSVIKDVSGLVQVLSSLRVDGVAQRTFMNHLLNDEGFERIIKDAADLKTLLEALPQDIIANIFSRPNYFRHGYMLAVEDPELQDALLAKLCVDGLFSMDSSFIASVIQLLSAKDLKRRVADSSFSFEQFSRALIHLGDHLGLELMSALEPEHLRRGIADFESFSLQYKRLNVSVQKALIEKLGRDALDSLIATAKNLVTLITFNGSVGYGDLALLEFLGDRLKGLVQNSDDLFALLSLRLSHDPYKEQAVREKFLASYSDLELRAFILTPAHLFRLIACADFSFAYRKAMIDRLGVSHCNSLVKSLEDLIGMMKLVSYGGWEIKLKDLVSADTLQALIKTPQDLGVLISIAQSFLPHSDGLRHARVKDFESRHFDMDAILNVLGSEHLLRVLPDVDALFLVAEKIKDFPQLKKFFVSLRAIGFSHLVADVAQLAQFFNKVSADQSLELAESFLGASWTSLITSQESLVQLLGSVDASRATVLLRHLHVKTLSPVVLTDSTVLAAVLAALPVHKAIAVARAVHSQCYPLFSRIENSIQLARFLNALSPEVFDSVRGLLTPERFSQLIPDVAQLNALMVTLSPEKVALILKPEHLSGLVNSSEKWAGLFRGLTAAHQHAIFNHAALSATIGTVVWNIVVAPKDLNVILTALDNASASKILEGIEQAQLMEIIRSRAGLVCLLQGLSFENMRSVLNKLDRHYLKDLMLGEGSVAEATGFVASYAGQPNLHRALSYVLTTSYGIREQELQASSCCPSTLFGASRVVKAAAADRLAAALISDADMSAVSAEVAADRGLSSSSKLNAIAQMALRRS